VLDFGLAKALDPFVASGSADISSMNSPTQTARATWPASCWARAAYMPLKGAREAGGSPGRCLGVRFGALRNAHRPTRVQREDTTDILASVLKQDPDWTALPPNVSPSIRRLLRRSLVKNPRARLSAMGDARLELDEQETDVEAATRPRAAHRTLWGALAVSSAVAAIAVIALVMLSRRPTSNSRASVVFSLAPSQGTTLFPDSTAVAISPDGRVVALVTGDVAAALPPNFTGLWIRAVDSLDARFLPGTEGAAFSVLVAVTAGSSRFSRIAN
jgi:hypothetical protein